MSTTVGEIPLPWHFTLGIYTGFSYGIIPFFPFSLWGAELGAFRDWEQLYFEGSKINQSLPWGGTNVPAHGQLGTCHLQGKKIK